MTPSADDFDYDLTATYDGVLWKTHGPTKCAGHHCTLHNPSNHHMREWPIVLSDGGSRTYRVCPHGLEHPDPDHVAYVRRSYGRIYARVISTHGGCDGCCRTVNHPDQTST